jgi:hypothetical protein
MIKNNKLRAGMRWHGTKQVPEFVKIIKDKHGRECYLSGTFKENGVWFQQIKYIDNDEFYTGRFDVLNKYFEENK